MWEGVLFLTAIVVVASVVLRGAMPTLWRLGKRCGHAFHRRFAKGDVGRVETLDLRE